MMMEACVENIAFPKWCHHHYVSPRPRLAKESFAPWANRRDREASSLVIFDV